MKKIVLIGIGAILLFAAAFGIYYKLQIAQPDADKFLPGGTVFYARFSNTGKSWQEFKETRLWRDLKGINIEKVLRKSGVPDKEISRYLKYRDETSMFLSKLMLDKFFGKEISIAVYPVEITNIFEKDNIGFLSNIVIVTRIEPGAKFAEAAARIYSKLDKRTKVNQKTYGKHKIINIPITYGMSLYYTTIKNFLVISTGSKYIRACIDTINKRTPSLSMDYGYKWVKSHSPRNSRTVTYFNLEKFVNTINKLNNAAKDKFPALSRNLSQIDGTLNKLRSLEIAGSYSGKNKNVSSSCVFLKAGHNILSSEYKTVFSAQPERNRALRFIPKNTILYQWSDTFNMREIWKGMKNSFLRETRNKMARRGLSLSASDESKMLDTMRSNINANLGCSFENDIFPLIGNEIGVALSDISTGGLFPIPKFFLFLRVANSSRAGDIVKKVLDKQNIPLENKSYKNVEIHYATLPFGANLQPAYAFIGSYLIVSSSKALLKESIDVYKNDSPSIKENVRFKSVDFGLSGKNISSSFVDIRTLMNKAEDVLEWGINWASALERIQKKQIEELKQEYTSLKEDISEKEAESFSLKTRAESLENQAALLRKQAADASGKEQELSDLNARIKLKESAISKETGKMNLYKRKIDKMKDNISRVNPGLISFYYNEAISPVIEGLKEIEALGLRTTVSGNVLKTIFYSKTE